MFKKLSYLIFVVLVLGFANNGLGATKIIVVTDNPAEEAGLEPFLKGILGNDITVEIEDAKYRTLDAAKRANLEAADLIIVSRQTDSGNYDDGDELEFWNGLETPILLQSAYLSRDSRWRWLQGGQHDADALTNMAVVDESNLIFSGVTITAGQVQIFPSAIDNTDVSDQDSAGNGTLIATPAGSTDVMIASWEPGTEYYPGSGQTAGGPRIAFLMLRPAQYLPTLTDDGKKMLENAVLLLLGNLTGGPTATEPNPADVQTDVPRDGILAWIGDELANTHDVYFGMSFDDVNDAGRANTLDVLVSQSQIANTHTPSDRLDFGQTYYWRIDEISAPPDSTVFKGDVWSFTTEPVGYPVANVTATASSSAANQGPENAVNGSGLSNDLHSRKTDAMWLSAIGGSQPTWIQFEFDRVHVLHEMWVWNSNTDLEVSIGFGSKDVSIEYSVDGADYTTLGTTHEFAQAPAADDYAHNTTVDFGGLQARYVRLTVNSSWGGFLPQYGLSEVRFLHIPLRARDPYPDLGATDAPVDVTLGFRAGREAAEHDVYFSTTEQAVIDGSALVTTVTETDYSPLSLDLGQTYYWRIDEVNMAETPAMLPGDVWSFTTQEFLAVDDFESYNDISAAEEGSNLIYLTWTDGFDNPSANGSTIGYVEAFQPSMEIGTVHGADQSVPLMYNNSAASLSEVIVDPVNLPIGRDWTAGSPQTLVLWFHGSPGNAVTEQMFVKINGVKVVYPGSAADIAEPRWKQWNIDLAAFGISLGNVTELAIGFERTGAIGGTGTVFIDDILLYRLAPEIVVPAEEIWIEAEAADTITEPMKTYDDPAASGGKYIGTTDDISNSSNEPPTPDGIASYTFTVAGGTYKISGRINVPSGNNSFWVQIQGAATAAETELHASGWVRWNDPPDAPNWFWNDVFSDDDDQDATVLFTMPAGTYTLEIGYRETGAMLDAIVISRID